MCLVALFPTGGVVLVTGFTRKLSLTSYSHRKFKELVFTPARDTLVVFVHDLITRDREGGVVDRFVYRDCCPPLCPCALDWQAIMEVPL